jgi:2-furoyl-CoA dehydrogenase large subunit
MLIDHHDARSPFTELGTKGCGENSAMSAPAAIASALDDALSPYKVTFNELPVTPTLIWQKLAGAA